MQILKDVLIPDWSGSLPRNGRLPLVAPPLTESDLFCTGSLPARQPHSPPPHWQRMLALIACT
eukprot:767502-Hanusia_phi.AAC.1